MSNNTNRLVALGALFLFGVFVGMLVSNAGQQVDFAIVSTNQGIGCRVSSNPALPK